MKKISGYVFFEQTRTAFTFTHKFWPTSKYFNGSTLITVYDTTLHYPKSRPFVPQTARCLSVCVFVYVTPQKLTAGGRTHDHDDLRQFAQFDKLQTN